MSDMTLPSRHRIRGSSPGGLSPSTSQPLKEKIIMGEEPSTIIVTWFIKLFIINRPRTVYESQTILSEQ